MSSSLTWSRTPLGRTVYQGRKPISHRYRSSTFEALTGAHDGVPARFYYTIDPAEDGWEGREHYEVISTGESGVNRLGSTRTKHPRTGWAHPKTVSGLKEVAEEWSTSTFGYGKRTKGNPADPWQAYVTGAGRSAWRHDLAGGGSVVIRETSRGEYVITRYGADGHGFDYPERYMAISNAQRDALKWASQSVRGNPICRKGAFAIGAGVGAAAMHVAHKRGLMNNPSDPGDIPPRVQESSYGFPFRSKGQSGRIRARDLYPLASAADKARIEHLVSQGASYSGEAGDVLGGIWERLGWPIPKSPSRRNNPRDVLDGKVFPARSYLRRFFDEKEVPRKTFEFTDSQGLPHSMPNDVVLEAIAGTTGAERAQIEGIIRKIDFANGDINHFLDHLARGLAENYKGAMRGNPRRGARRNSGRPSDSTRGFAFRDRQSPFPDTAGFEGYKRRRKQELQALVESYPDAYFASMPEANYVYAYPMTPPQDALDLTSKEWAALVYAEGRRRGLAGNAVPNPGRYTRRNPELKPGAVVGARRWPEEGGRYGKPWKGVLLRRDDLRAWNSMGFRTRAEAAAHVACVGGIPDQVPVLWTFDDRQQVWWEKLTGDYAVRPYKDDLAAWRKANAMVKPVKRTKRNPHPDFSTRSRCSQP